MRRLLVERVGRADLADLAEVHDDDAIAHVLHDREVVRDEDQREAVAGLHVLEQVEDLRLHRHVERRHRLVADDQLRVGDDGARDRDALALSTGELVRPTTALLRRVETDGEHRLVDLLLLLLLGADAPDPQPLGDDVLDLAPRVQRRDRVLEDHLHARTRLAQLVAAQMRHVGALEEDLSRVRARELHDRLAGGRLSAARLPDQTEGLPFLHVEADVGHGVDLQTRPADGKLDDQVLDAQQRLLGRTQVRGAGSGHQAITAFAPVVSVAPTRVTVRPVAVTPAARLRVSASAPASVPTG